MRSKVKGERDRQGERGYIEKSLQVIIDFSQLVGKSANKKRENRGKH